MTKVGLFFLVALLVLSGSVAMAQLPNHPLLEQAESQCAQRLSYAKENHARIKLTSDGKVFTCYGFPKA